MIEKITYDVPAPRNQNQINLHSHATSLTRGFIPTVGSLPFPLSCSWVGFECGPLGTRAQPRELKQLRAKDKRKPCGENMTFNI